MTCRLSLTFAERLRLPIERLVQRGLDRATLPPAQRAPFVDTSGDDVRLLERLTGRDLSSWLAPA